MTASFMASTLVKVLRSAPTPVTATYTYFSIPTVAPLTTSWTPPAQCASALPTIAQGTCYGPQSCYAGTADINYLMAHNSFGAEFNYQYWTTSYSQVTNSCLPPNSQAVSYFHYSPALGCPGSYQTVSTYSPYSDGLWALCCPKYVIQLTLPWPIYLANNSVKRLYEIFISRWRLQLLELSHDYTTHCRGGNWMGD
jgi:hypothetical protein